MKILILFTLSLMFIFGGCDNEKSDKSNQEANNQNKQLQKESKKTFNLSLNDGITIEITVGENSVKATNTDLPTVLLFTSNNCKPCSLQIPYIATLAEKYKNELKVIVLPLDQEINESEQTSYEISTLNNKEIAKALNIDSLPFIIISNKNGEIVRKYRGIAPVEMIETDVNMVIL